MSLAVAFTGGALVGAFAMLVLLIVLGKVTGLAQR